MPAPRPERQRRQGPVTREATDDAFANGSMGDEVLGSPESERALMRQQYLEIGRRLWETHRYRRHLGLDAWPNAATEAVFQAFEGRSTVVDLKELGRLSALIVQQQAFEWQLSELRSDWETVLGRTGAPGSGSTNGRPQPPA